MSDAKTQDRHFTDWFQTILDRVQGKLAPNRCKHDVGLYECLEDCPDCFEEALREFYLEVVERIQ